MNRLNFQRLFRGNENSSRRMNNNNNRNNNNNNISNFSLPFEVTHNVNLYDNQLNSNDINPPNSDSINSTISVNTSLSPQLRINASRTYPSPTQSHIRNSVISRQYSVNENSLNNPYYNENHTTSSNSLDPSGRINEICIANINNKCKFGDRCRFVHGTPCLLCQQNVYNPSDDMSSQMKEHSKECPAIKSNIKNVNDEKESEEKEVEQNYTCTICLENIVPPMKFGVLCNCSHYFCYECIKIWRNSQDFSDINNHLKCPLCKTKSQFMIPSVVFPKNEAERKLLIKKYKQELANTECRKLRETYYKFCPYGDNCKPDGHYISFSYLNNPNQFISPEEYAQNIVQNDTNGIIQYYNNRFMEEAILVDDGDGYGMHNGVFTNPFYHSDDSFDNDLLSLNSNSGIMLPGIQNTGLYDESADYMFNEAIDGINEINIDETENDNNSNVSDINDSDISDYLDEIDEDLNLYFMMNNRIPRRHSTVRINSSTSPLSNRNSYIENMNRSNTRNSFIENSNRSNVRNSLIENMNRSNNRNSFIENMNRSNNRNSFIENMNRSSNRNSFIENMNRSNTRNSFIENNQSNNRSFSNQRVISPRLNRSSYISNESSNIIDNSNVNSNNLNCNTTTNNNDNSISLNNITNNNNSINNNNVNSIIDNSNSDT
ncbi:hypothetical protein PIROE2DRAFT_2681, partial [Piromyces sp. E2]